MATVTFGAARQRINALVEMHAQAKLSGDKPHSDRIFDEIFSLLFVAAEVYASQPQFRRLSEYERENIRDQVSDRLVKMVGWFKLEHGIPFTGFVGREFRNHPNTPPKHVFQRESITTSMTQVNPESGKEYIPKPVNEASERLTLTPLQAAQNSEYYERLRRCLGEVESTDYVLLEKWGVVYSEDVRDLQTIPMRFRASVISRGYHASSPPRPAATAGERDMFMRDPYLKRRLWL